MRDERENISRENWEGKRTVVEISATAKIMTYTSLFFRRLSSVIRLAGTQKRREDEGNRKTDYCSEARNGDEGKQTRSGTLQSVDASVLV